MPVGLPIMLVNLTDALCVVVGGGAVAERKTRALLDAAARVRVIAPALTEELAADANDGEIEWLAREYRAGDLEGAFLVIAATNAPRVNEEVWREAVARGCLVNVVDDPLHCNFIAPAVVRRGDLTIAVSTGGDVPALAAHLRGQLEQQFGAEWSAYVEWLARAREQIAARYADPKTRRRVWLRLLDSNLRELVRAQDDDEIQARLTQLIGGQANDE